MLKKLNSLRCSGPQAWQGLPEDKPAGTTADGSTFYEVTTGVKWIYHEDDWIEDLSLIYALLAVQAGGR